VGSYAGVQRTIRLGDRELERIGLGTNRLTDTPANRELLSTAVELGIGMIDSAHIYTGGESERTIGATISPVPAGVVVASKGGYRPGTGHPDRLREQLSRSFASLRTETIALFYLHRIDPKTPLEESLEVLREFQEQGRIEHIGVSDVSVDQIERAREVVPIAAVQNAYNLSERRYDDVVEYCAEEGLLFVPYYPLHGEAPAAREIADRLGATPNQVMLAWLLARSPAILPIPGTLSLDHLRENLSALELELSDSDYEALTEAVSSPP
jgi:aryl-alcohol dehydrogenase-like predicted oxidoreductase